MSETTVTNQQVPPRRRLRRVIELVLVLALFGGMGTVAWYGIKSSRGKQLDDRYQAAVAAAQAKDPRWRWDDVIADRATVPDDQNGALIVMAAFKLLPSTGVWPPSRTSERPASPLPGEGPAVAPQDPDSATRGFPYPQAVLRLVPAGRLGDPIAGELRAELNKVQPALVEARKLADRPTGRFPITWDRDPLPQQRPYMRQTRPVAELLFLDAALAADEGAIDQALVRCRATLNVGRALGDEPFCTSLGNRFPAGRLAVHAAERALGQGTASPEILVAIQKLLEDEIARPLAHDALRSERQIVAEGIGKLCAGQQWIEEFGDPRNNPPDRMNQVLYLETANRLLDALDEPGDARLAAVHKVQKDLNAQGFTKYRPAAFFLTNTLRTIDEEQRYHADLQDGRVGLAVERYRLARGAWPESLQQLVPEFLSAVPAGSFGSGSLRLSRLSDGVRIHSVDPDVSEGAASIFVVNNPPDIGFRLWDPALRHQPAAVRPSMDELRNPSGRGAKPKN